MKPEKCSWPPRNPAMDRTGWRFRRNLPVRWDSKALAWWYQSGGCGTKPLMKCVITSVASRVTRVFAQAVRSRGIENSLHWVLDVTFAEDASRIRKDNAAELFLVAAFGRESFGKRRRWRKLSDEKVPGGFRQQLSGQSRGQLKDKESES